MITSGVRKIRLLDPKQLVRPGRTLARAFVAPGEAGSPPATLSQDLASKADRWLSSQAKSRGWLGRLVRRRVPSVLLSEKLDPQLKLEIAKAGIGSEVRWGWRRLTSFFGLFGGPSGKPGAGAGSLAQVAKAVTHSSPSGSLDAFLSRLYGDSAAIRQENARRAIGAFKTMVATAGGYGHGAELDRLVASALKNPGKLPLAGRRADFVSRQLAELRMSLALGEAGSAGRLVQIRRDLGISRDFESIVAVAGDARNGAEFATGIRKLMSRLPNKTQGNLIADLGAALDRLYAAAKAAL